MTVTALPLPLPLSHVHNSWHYNTRHHAGSVAYDAFQAVPGSHVR